MGAEQAKEEAPQSASDEIMQSLEFKTQAMHITERKQAIQQVANIRKLHSAWHRRMPVADVFDPRSPTIGLKRTPLKQSHDFGVSRAFISAGLQLLDPRSPSQHQLRTPIGKIVDAHTPNEGVSFSFSEATDADSAVTSPQTPASRGGDVNISAVSTPVTPATPAPIVSEMNTPATPLVFTSPKKQVKVTTRKAALGSAKSAKSASYDKENEVSINGTPKTPSQAHRSAGTPNRVIA
eukprot:TRINITY_DN10037_c0_g1_i1.p1 TRINITY_DN10037_c0_g1~~TRINITY_DN10037_c0_g1_i1.p1  ORF type:complete len:251 (+),score=39.13 TRINITY_DN10037_c0_g1_i1:43-753(+)